MHMTRTMMLEVLRQDYIGTAWAKGLLGRSVILRHAIKNAINQVVTLVGMQLPILVGGAVIIENIFNLPGLGRLMLDAAQRPRLPAGVGGEPVLRHGGGGQPADRSAVRVAGPADSLRMRRHGHTVTRNTAKTGKWGRARWPPLADQSAQQPRDAKDHRNLRRALPAGQLLRTSGHGHSVTPGDHANRCTGTADWPPLSDEAGPWVTYPGWHRPAPSRSRGRLGRRG